MMEAMAFLEHSFLLLPLLLNRSFLLSFQMTPVIQFHSFTHRAQCKEMNTTGTVMCCAVLCCTVLYCTVL